MLFASSLGDQFGSAIIFPILFIAIAIHYGKKFGNANPGVKDAAKKAVASKAIELIGRLIKKK